MTERLLLRGGHVTHHRIQIWAIWSSDVLIEDRAIAAVQPDLGDTDAEVIDVERRHRDPGSSTPTGTRGRRRSGMRARMPPSTTTSSRCWTSSPALPHRRTCTPPNLFGASECVNALDHHPGRLVSTSDDTPEHPDAAIQGLQEAVAGRCTPYGSADTSLAAYWFDSELVIPADDVHAGPRDVLLRQTMGCSRWGSPPEAPGSARSRWSGPSGDWPASWASRSPSTWRWAGWLGRFSMVKTLQRDGASWPGHDCISTAAT